MHINNFQIRSISDINCFFQSYKMCDLYKFYDSCFEYDGDNITSLDSDVPSWVVRILHHFITTGILVIY